SKGTELCSCVTIHFSSILQKQTVVRHHRSSCPPSVQVDLALLDFLDELRVKDIHVDFQADSECCLRADAGAYSARFRSHCRPMKLESIAPKSFIRRCR